MSPQPPRDGEFIPGPGTGAAPGWSARRAVWRTPIVTRSLSFGSMLAIAISYDHNTSIGWAILHGLLSWFFVVYAALFY